MEEKYPAILGLATEVPSQCYLQNELLDLLKIYLNPSAHTQKIFQNAGVGSRYLAVAGSYYEQERTTQERNERYLVEAMNIGSQAARQCLANSEIDAKSVTDLIVVSCTGIDTPGLDLRIAKELEMSPWLQRTCVLGMGCYGAFPGLLRARQAVQAKPGGLALLICVEICSLHFQPGDETIENVVSSALFSDGAAAVLVGSQLAGSPHLIDSATFSDYQTFDHMAFHLTNHGFRMSLSAYVPRLLAANVEDFVDTLLKRNGLERSQVDYWGVHPGSSKIIDYVQDRLGLPDEALDSSRRILFEYGNMSSPTVLFVLNDIILERKPSQGDRCVIMSFGPGLTMEAALVGW